MAKLAISAPDPIEKHLKCLSLLPSTCQACHKLTKDIVQDLQLLEEVLEAMTEAVQKQQSTRDEMQQREDKNLQTKQKNLRKAQSLRDSWHGEHSGMKGADL